MEELRGALVNLSALGDVIDDVLVLFVPFGHLRLPSKGGRGHTKDA